MMFAVIIGALAAVINTFRLSLFFEAEFLFGQFLVLLVAIYRGPVFGLLAAMVATIPLIIGWESFWPVLTFGLEAIVIGFLARNNKSKLILAVIAYWLFIGMPLSWLSISNFEFFEESHKLSILIKQIANAIIYANIAAIFILIPYVKKLFRDTNKQQTKALSLQNQSSYLISTLLITLGVLFFLYNLNQRITTTISKLTYSHENKHVQLKYQINALMNAKLDALGEFRYFVSEVWDSYEKRKTALIDFYQRHPIFSTMVIANKQGHLINTSPPALVENVSQQGESINVSDRSYFVNAIEQERTYVSPGFEGRGFGNDLIVAVSVSVPGQAPLHNQNVGVIEGSFILYFLKEIKEAINNITFDVDAVLLDQNNKVLMASDSLDLTPLEEFKFKYTDSPKGHLHYINLVYLDDSLSEYSYFYTETALGWGWKIVTLQNESSFAKVIEQSLLFFTLSIMIVVVISYVLAWGISHSWSYYLQILNEHVKRGESFDNEISAFETNDYLPEEVNNFYQEIKNSRQHILKMNRDLQHTIAERIENLQVVNKKLHAMARQDELTGLSNRRVFNVTLNELWIECQREFKPLSMLIVDIDYFKKLNDTYGHPVGDEVLVVFGQMLKEYLSHEVKNISRLGGEEFSLLLKGGGHQNAVRLAEQIRKATEEKVIPIGAGDQSIQITISVGVATIDATVYTASKLYQLADNALYEAKKTGRNSVKEIMPD